MTAQDPKNDDKKSRERLYLIILIISLPILALVLIPAAIFLPDLFDQKYNHFIFGLLSALFVIKGMVNSYRK